MKLKPLNDADKIRRILENKALSTEEIITLWTDAFPTLVIWSDEEIKEHLTEIFEFNEEETNILMEKYQTLIQNKVSPLKEMTTLPNLDKIDPDLHNIINTDWETLSFIKRARKSLDHSELLRYFHESKDEFEKFESEKDEIKKQIQNIEKRLNKRLQKYLNYNQ
tara:strand:- start:161 stop:655 length:495 start_codon:yes stop_codon:yes gene_type:complete